MGQRLVALIAVTAALLLVALRAPAEREAPGEAPFAGLPFPAEVQTEGPLRVQGRRVEASTLLSSESVEELIARHRAVFASRPVDLLEEPIEGGRLLSVLDVQGGRHLVIAARFTPRGTELVRGWASLGEEASPAEPLPLPRGWLPLAEVEDRLGESEVRHLTALAPAGIETARQALADALVRQGWRPLEDGRFARESDRLEAHFEPEAGGVAALLVIRREAR